MRNPSSFLVLVALLVAGALVLTGCGDSVAGTAASSPPDASASGSGGCPVAAAATGGGSSCAGTAESTACEAACEGDGAHGSDTKASPAACTCAAGKAGEPVWCEACEVGYVDGEKADCRGCVDTARKKAAAAVGE